MTDFSGVNELLIPEWNSGQNGLEQFIFELTAAKSMGVLQPDKSLIYASLVKSQKVSLLSNLNNTQLNNLDNFITYLRDTFGLSLAEQRQSFSDIRQLEDENEILYLERVKKHYTSSRQIQVGHFTTWMKEDVKISIYLRAQQCGITKNNDDQRTKCGVRRPGNNRTKLCGQSQGHIKGVSNQIK